MSAAPRFYRSRPDTVTFEFEERDRTISGEVDRAGFVHEAWLVLAYLNDREGQDPIDVTEAVRNSPIYMKQIEDFVMTYDWVSRELTRKYSDFEKL